MNKFVRINFITKLIVKYFGLETVTHGYFKQFSLQFPQISYLDEYLKSIVKFGYIFVSFEFSLSSSTELIFSSLTSLINSSVD